MNKRQMIEDHLDKAHRHVATGQECIERQRAVITRLEAIGLDTQQARALLSLFLDLQEKHVRDRADLALELYQYSEKSRQV